jgi:hypothetical protein
LIWGVPLAAVDTARLLSTSPALLAMSMQG